MINKLFPKNIYLYKKIDNSFGICVYICDTDNANEIIVGCIEDIDPLNNEYLKLENGLNKVLYLDRYLTLKMSSIMKPLYIKGEHLFITSKEFFILTSNIYKLLMLKYENMVGFYNNDNYNNESLRDITFPEKIIKYLTWQIKKLDIKLSLPNTNLKIMEHCIYFVYMGTNIGAEVDKLRPVLVWRKHENKDNHEDDSYFVFPLSTKKSRKYYKHNVILNLNGTYNKIMINQGRIISRKRFVKIFESISTNQVLRLTTEQKEMVKEAIKFYFGV